MIENREPESCDLSEHLTSGLTATGLLLQSLERCFENGGHKYIITKVHKHNLNKQ